MPKQLPIKLTKWNYDEARNLVTATQRVTSDDVEEVLDAVCDFGVYNQIIIFSGVHGEPGGILQVADPKFFAADAELAQEGSGKPHDPTIVVQKMPLQQTTPVVLTEALLQKSTAVILAWCYSNGYVT